MAFSENSRQSLIPNFLYSPSLSRNMVDLECSMNRTPDLPSPQSTASSSPSDARVSRSFLVPAPSERGRIEMFSPAYYAASATAGSLSCWVTHTALTPVDVLKCNMQVYVSYTWICFSIEVYHFFFNIRPPFNLRGLKMNFKRSCHMKNLLYFFSTNDFVRNL